MIPRILPGLYRHYKGNLYRVLFGAADYTGEHGTREDTLGVETREGFPEGEKLVVYIGLYDNPHGNRECVRPAREFGAMLDEAPLTAEEWERAVAKPKGIIEEEWAEEIRARYVEGTYTGPRYERIGD